MKNINIIHLHTVYRSTQQQRSDDDDMAVTSAHARDEEYKYNSLTYCLLPHTAAAQ